MSQISNVVGVVAGLLNGAGGLQANIDALATAESLPDISVGSQQVIAQNLPAEIAERNTPGKYPCVLVYFDEVANRLREKSRVFSGTAGMAIEARVSSDRVEDLDAQLNVLVDAVTSTLDQNRGDWGDGIFFGGEYKISFAAVKHGGKNFMQTAKVTFTLDVSRN
jgi:hypothetical protein